MQNILGKFVYCHKCKISIPANLDLLFVPPKNSIPMVKSTRKSTLCLKCLSMLFRKLDFLTKL